jgi:hypothetical protein
MKYGARLLVLAVSTLAATLVEASNADLHVAGSIVPGGACGIKLGDGPIKLGRINRDKLDDDQPTVVFDQRIRMDINCAGPSRYALVASNPLQVDVSDGARFGLVSNLDQSVVGSFSLRFDSGSVRIDGHAGYYTAAAQNAGLESASWGPSTSNVLPLLYGDYAMGFVASDGSRESPAFTKDLYTHLLLAVVIKPMKDIDLSDDVDFTGSVDLEIRYF